MDGEGWGAKNRSEGWGVKDGAKNDERLKDRG
jgi:hypothetical protein